MPGQKLPFGPQPGSAVLEGLTETPDRAIAQSELLPHADDQDGARAAA
jgi:hypothetical protein